MWVSMAASRFCNILPENFADLILLGVQRSQIDLDKEKLKKKQKKKQSWHLVSLTDVIRSMVSLTYSLVGWNCVLKSIDKYVCLNVSKILWVTSRCAIDPFYLKPVQIPFQHRLILCQERPFARVSAGFDSSAIQVRQMKEQTWSLSCIKRYFL